MDSKKQSSEHGWHEQAEACKREAEKLPYGRRAKAVAQGPATGDRVPHQRMGVLAGAVVTEVNCLFWFVRGTIIGLL
jgi:hypothetical protein